MLPEWVRSSRLEGEVLRGRGMASVTIEAPRASLLAMRLIGAVYRKETREHEESQELSW